jgi:AraC family transcriptional regulator
MNANIQRKITLPEMAELTNLSPNHFCRLFKSETGLPPLQYLTKLRMEKARHLLVTSFLNIKQIMAMTGYDARSRGNFGKQFRRYFGIIPTQYRKRFFTHKLR